MSYTRPDYNAADASWVGASTYARPDYDAADASFVNSVRNLYIGETPITDIQFGSTPINAVYYGSTLIWESLTPTVLLVTQDETPLITQDGNPLYIGV